MKRLSIFGPFVWTLSARVLVGLCYRWKNILSIYVCIRNGKKWRKKRSWLLLWFVCDKFLLIPFKITVILKRKTDQGKKKVLRSHRIEKLLTQLSCIRRHNGCAQCVSWRKNIENPCIAKVIEIYSICSSPPSVLFHLIFVLGHDQIHKYTSMWAFDSVLYL